MKTYNTNSYWLNPVQCILMCIPNQINVIFMFQFFIEFGCENLSTNIKFLSKSITYIKTQNHLSRGNKDKSNSYCICMSIFAPFI